MGRSGGAAGPELGVTVAHQRLFIEVPYWLRELWSVPFGW